VPLLIDDARAIEPFIVMHATKIGNQDFKTIVKVCIYDFC
jgi:hypothetical protein